MRATAWQLNTIWLGSEYAPYVGAVNFLDNISHLLAPCVSAKPQEKSLDSLD